MQSTDSTAMRETPEAITAGVVTDDGRTFLKLGDRRLLAPTYTYNASPGDGTPYTDEGEANRTRHARQMVDQGVRVIFCNVTGPWRCDGSFDTGVLDRALGTFADAPEDLGLIVRFTVTTPEDFAQRHPGELVRFAHVPEEQTGHDEYRGGLLNVLPRFASFASPAWREAGRRYLDAVIDFVQRHPQAGRVIGYMINTGETAEGILWGYQEGLFGDYSQPAVTAFRRWLEDRYGDEAAFRQACGDPGFSMDKALPPSLERRTIASLGELRDPRKDRLVIDYDLFQSDLVVEALLHWHRHVRGRLGSEKLLGCFYGYGMWGSGMLNTTPPQGHCALARLLEAPELDFVTGITTYWKRALGQPGQYMLPVASVARHGKLHWNEDDLRTHVVLSNDNVWATPAAGVPLNAGGSCSLYRRQFARALSDGGQTWYYDIVAGMYDDPRILEEFRRHCRIADHLRDADMGSCAEVACVVSELAAVHHRLYPGTLHQYRESAADLLCDRVTEGLYRTGVSLDWYLSSDLPRADFSRYRVIYFFNQVIATEQERAAIEALKKEGRTLIFLWSPGFLTESGAGARFSTQLTGIRMQDTPWRGPARVRITDFDTPMTRELATVRSIGTDLVYSPLLAIDDPETKVFGVYEASGAPAAAYRVFKDWTSVVLGTCTSEMELLRGIFRHAGCTIRCETGDVLLENRSVLGVHTCHAGPLVLRLPPGCSGLQDLISGHRFRAEEGLVHVGYVGRGQTRLFLKERQVSR